MKSLNNNNHNNPNQNMKTEIIILSTNSSYNFTMNTPNYNDTDDIFQLRNSSFHNIYLFYNPPKDTHKKLYIGVFLSLMMLITIVLFVYWSDNLFSRYRTDNSITSMSSKDSYSSNNHVECVIPNRQLKYDYSNHYYHQDHHQSNTVNNTEEDYSSSHHFLTKTINRHNNCSSSGATYGSSSSNDATCPVYCDSPTGSCTSNPETIQQKNKVFHHLISLKKTFTNDHRKVHTSFF